MPAAPVSIVIPVFNRYDLLRETIDSIRSQTVSPSEIILVDDGSIDGTRDEIRGLDDPLIRVFLNTENLGAGKARNRGIESAKYDFLCLTDQDDIWLPTKLEKQVDRMSKPDAPVLVGTRAETFSLNAGEISLGNEFSHYAEDASLREYFFYSSPFVSSSVMVRRSALSDHGLHFRSDMGKSSCEDYDLWWRLSLVGQLANVPEVLLKYREHATQQSRLREDDINKYSDVVRNQVLQERGIQLSDEQRETLTLLGRYTPAFPDDVPKIRTLLLEFLDRRADLVSKDALRVHAEMAFQAITRSKLSQTKKLQAVMSQRDGRLGGIGYLLNQIKRVRH